jgi:hypothetical protein
MADEPIKPNPPVDITEVEALRESVRKLEANNKKLMDQYVKAQETAKAVPPDVDVNALIAFKQQKEQEELEAKGRYDEAIAKQAQQYRDAEEAKNKRIQDHRAVEQRQLKFRLKQWLLVKRTLLQKNLSTLQSKVGYIEQI